MPALLEDRLFSTVEVARLLGEGYEQVNRWVLRLGAPAPGSGVHRRVDWSWVLALAAGLRLSHGMHPSGRPLLVAHRMLVDPGHEYYVAGDGFAIGVDGDEELLVIIDLLTDEVGGSATVVVPHLLVDPERMVA